MSERTAWGRTRVQAKQVQHGHDDLASARDRVRGALASPGESLDAATRAFFEPRIGYDFSRVRIHSGRAAEESARDVNAHAYAVGNSIVFGANRFSPYSDAGRWLIAHELVHIIQQSGVDRVHADQSDMARLPRARVAVSNSQASQVIRRYTTSDCDTTQAGLIDAAIARAKGNLGTAISRLAASPLPQDTQNALWLYFRDSSPGTATTVSTNLKKILASVGRVSYECENDCPEEGLGYTRLGTMVTGLGNIHLCMNNLEGTADAVSNTIIHEVAHYSLLASDSAGYFDPGCQESDTTVGAGSGTRLSLADSYSCFVDNLARGSAAARSEARGDLTGANIAGIAQVPAGPIDLNARPRRPIFAMKLTRGPLAQIAGVAYRWILRDQQDRSYLMTDTSGAQLFQFRPAVESVIAIINTRTRNLLKERGVTSGRVLCRAASPVFGQRLFEIPVTFQS